MSIDEMRFQDAHEFEQVQPNYNEQQYYHQNHYNPCQNHGFINEGQQPRTKRIHKNSIKNGVHTGCSRHSIHN